MRMSWHGLSSSLLKPMVQCGSSSPIYSKVFYRSILLGVSRSYYYAVCCAKYSKSAKTLQPLIPQMRKSCSNIVRISKSTRPARPWCRPETTSWQGRSHNISYLQQNVRNLSSLGVRGLVTEDQVSSMLRANEDYVHVGGAAVGIGGSAVSHICTNKLASNSPIEDRRGEAECLITGGHLFGVFDGHGGTACAQAVSERLFDYTAVTLLNPDQLEEHTRWISSGGGFSSTSSPRKLVKWLRKSGRYDSADFAESFRLSVNRLALAKMSSLMAEDGDEAESGDMSPVAKAMIEASITLDQDIGTQGVSASKVDADLLSIALSGCCASLVHIKGKQVHAANVGDCQAVIGRKDSNGVWSAVRLGFPHSRENPEEMSRILSEHPNEASSVVRHGRLLGVLAPFRAFGDFKFKWRAQTIHKLRDRMQHFPFDDEDLAYFSPYYYTVPQGYFTPPYLTACPEITAHTLTTEDKFMVIATDGLWDMFYNPPSDVVRLTAAHYEHMNNGGSIGPDAMPLPTVKSAKLAGSASSVAAMLDSNVSTHLIRHALGEGVRSDRLHSQVSGMLSLPPAVVRSYRDDITVTVVFFDEDYL